MQQYDKILEPSLFWFWNATPDKDGINFQLDEFCSKGIKSVYIHPMPDDFRKQDFFKGMEVEYLSAEYFELVAYTCEQIHQRGMLLWLYDEGGWPSGVAGGKVVKTNPHYGIWALKRTGNKIEQIQFLPECNYPDLTNRDATQCFIEHTHEKYRQYIGDKFGTTVPGIFTDEPRIIGCLGTDTIPWSPAIAEHFHKQHGCKLEDVVDKLFEDKAQNPSAKKIHRNYLYTLSRLIAENYFKPISNWCKDNNLFFEGHHSGENQFGKHGQYFGHFFEQAKNYDIPGVDTIWREIFPGSLSGNYVKLASSVARLYDKIYVISESFNVYGAGLTLEQMRWVIAYQMVRGVNRIGFMPALYDTAGARRISTCNDISPANPVWKDIGILIEHIRQTTNFINDGKLKPLVGVYYRTELIENDELAKEFNSQHEKLCDMLFDSFVPFIFISMNELQKTKTHEEKLLINDILLSHIIIHNHDQLEEKEKKLFKRFAGSNIGISYLNDNQNIDECMEQYSCKFADLKKTMSDKFASIETDEAVKDINLLVVYKNNSAKLLFFNKNPKKVEFSFRTINDLDGMILSEEFIGDNVSCIFEPFYYSRGRYKLTLQPGQMRAFTAEPARTFHEHRQYKCIETQRIDDKWTVLEVESFEIKEKIEISTEQKTSGTDSLGDYINVNSAFSGSLLYKKTLDFTVKSGEKVVLNLGKLWYSAETFINSKSCGARAWFPYIFDITDKIKQGDNLLEIRVTNTLANQWARKNIRKKDFSFWKNMYLEKSTPFIDQSCHAGLAGPVTLIRYQRIDQYS